MFTTLLSRVLGVVKAMVTTHFFGAGAIADAINFAYNIPNSARKLFAEGAFSTSYIPSFSAFVSDDERTNRLTSVLLGFQLVLFIPIILLSFLFSKNVIELFSAFENPEQIAVASSLLPLFTVFLCFISFGAVFSGILQARSSFLMVGICPVFYSLSVILGIVFFAPGYGPLAFGLATIVGAFAQALSCAIIVKRLGLRVSFSLHFSDPDFLDVLRRMVPVTLTSLFAIFSQQITYSFASMLPEGSITAFANSIILYQTPYGIFFTAIATVYYPVFNRAQDEKERSGELMKGLSDLFCFLLPSSIILIAMGRDIIAVLFQHGAFTADNTLMTYRVAEIYFAILVPLGFYSLLQRYCYSINRYWYTTIVTLSVSALDLALTYFFIVRMESPVALPIAFAVSQVVGLVLLFIKVRNFDWLSFFKALMKLVVANIPIAVAAFCYAGFVPDYSFAGTTLKSFLTAFASGVIFVVLLLVSYIVFRIPFMRAIRRKNATK
jgi:integral membrane protein MviN